MSFSKPYAVSFSPSLSPVEKIGGLFCTGLQYADHPLLMIAGEMCVLECHADVLVPHQSLHGCQVDAAHDQPTRKSMAQVMEGKIYHTRLTYCMCKCRTEGSIGLPRTGPKHWDISRHTHSNCLQRGGQHFIHRHATTLIVFGICCAHGHYPLAEVDVGLSHRE